MCHNEGVGGTAKFDQQTKAIRFCSEMALQNDIRFKRGDFHVSWEECFELYEKTRKLHGPYEFPPSSSIFYENQL